jgi:hypothetical protein
MTPEPPTAVRTLPVADHELARRVLHWLAVGGIALGAAQAIITSAMLLAWGLPLSLGMSIGLDVLYRVSAAVAVIAPVMLVAGSGGLLREKPWARALLTGYAFLQIAGAVASQGFSIWFAYEMSRFQNVTGAQRAMAAFGGVENLLLHCIYPAAIILFLVRPGLIPMASPAGSTFEVLPVSAPPPVRPT